MKIKTKNKKRIYMTKKRKSQKRFNDGVVKYLAIITFLLILPSEFIRVEAKKLNMELDEAFKVEMTQTIEPYQNTLKSTNIDKYDGILDELGDMGEAIKKSAIEYGENEAEIDLIIRLTLGIANAESSMGKKFYKESDKDCRNWWGIRKVRKDGSWLRCYSTPLEGANDFAIIIKNFYIDEGKTTPNKIANKYVGNKWSKFHASWINNVNEYYNL